MEPQEIKYRPHSSKEAFFYGKMAACNCSFKRPQDDVPSLTNHGTFEGVALNKKTPGDVYEILNMIHLRLTPLGTNIYIYIHISIYPLPKVPFF